MANFYMEKTSVRDKWEFKNPEKQHTIFNGHGQSPSDERSDVSSNTLVLSKKFAVDICIRNICSAP